MKSRSNNSNKAEKKMFEAKTVINYISLETGCDLCLQRLSYNLTGKIFKKNKAQKPKIIFENRYFQKPQQTKDYNKKRRFTFQHPRKPIGPVFNKIKSRAHKKKQIQKKPKLQTNLQHDTV